MPRPSFSYRVCSCNQQSAKLMTTHTQSFNNKCRSNKRATKPNIFLPYSFLTCAQMKFFLCVPCNSPNKSSSDNQTLSSSIELNLHTSLDDIIFTFNISKPLQYSTFLNYKANLSLNYSQSSALFFLPFNVKPHTHLIILMFAFPITRKVKRGVSLASHYRRGHMSDITQSDHLTLQF